MALDVLGVSNIDLPIDSFIRLGRYDLTDTNAPYEMQFSFSKYPFPYDINFYLGQCLLFGSMFSFKQYVKKCDCWYFKPIEATFILNDELLLSDFYDYKNEQYSRSIDIVYDTFNENVCFHSELDYFSTLYIYNAYSFRKRYIDLELLTDKVFELNLTLNRDIIPRITDKNPDTILAKNYPYILNLFFDVENKTISFDVFTDFWEYDRFNKVVVSLLPVKYGTFILSGFDIDMLSVNYADLDFEKLEVLLGTKS